MPSWRTADATPGRELVLVTLGFALATLWLLAPLSLHPASVARVDNADTQFLIWNVAWVARALIVDPLHVLDANIFYPHRGTLAYSEPNLGAGILALPVYWTTRNPFAAYNAVVLLSFVLSGVAMYYLVRYLVHDRRAAAVAAVCFAYCPYVFARLPHVHLLMTAGLPLSMLAFHRLADRPGAGRAALLGLALAAQALLCGYYAVFAGLVVGFAVLVMGALRHLWTDRRYWLAVAAAAVVAILSALPLFLPFARLQQSTGFSRTLDDARFWSADWRAYLASSAHAHAWMLPWLHHWKDVLFPGFAATVLGAAGATTGWRATGGRREIAVLYGGLAVAATWASFGPDAGLYRILYATLPIFSLIRTPSRFGLVATFALCVLAGAAVSTLMEKLGSRSRSGSSGPVRWLGLPAVAGTALVAVAVAELKVPLSFPDVPAVESAYRMLATLPPGPIVEIPFYSTRFAFSRTHYMLGSTAHWMPLVNGYSSHIPQDLLDETETLGGFPSVEAFRLLEARDVRYALVHAHLLTPASRKDVRARFDAFPRNLVQRYEDDDVWLYEIAVYPR